MASTIPKTMRAIEQNGPGGADTLFLNPNYPAPTPPSDRILIKVRAFALNRLDLFQRAGAYPPPPGTSPVLGVEFSGTVVTPKDGWEKGDEVIGLTPGGAYAEYMVTHPKLLVRKPKHLSWEQAAAVIQVYLTAIKALYFVGRFEKGKSVLFHGGASGVGVAAAQLVEKDGGEFYFTAGSREKVEFVEKELGAKKGWNYKEEDWEKGVQEATDGKGVDVIIDPVVGNSYFQKAINSVARDGTIVLLGFLQGFKTDGKVDLARILRDRIRIEGTTLRTRTVDYQSKLVDVLKEKVLPYLEVEGGHKIVVDEVFSWKDVAKAHEKLAANDTIGKIVCVVD